MDTPLGIDWVEIPAGDCIIGLSDEQKHSLLGQLQRQIGGVRQLLDDNRRRLQVAKSVLSDVREQQHLQLHAFHISRYPITIRQYNKYQESQGMPVSTYDKRQLELGWGKLPKVVGHEGALDFCNHLGVRLPTSIEWEKAARGPLGLLYPWGNKWDLTRANADKTIARKTTDDRKLGRSWIAEVDAFPSGQSIYGVWDLVGNIQEWTSSMRSTLDTYGNTVEVHVVRRWPIKLCDDLAWVDNLLAVEHLNHDGHSHPDSGIGFRVVRD